MRILLLNYEYPPIGAGAANATAAIGRALVALGHTACVLSARWASLPVDSLEDGVRVVRVRTRRARQDRSTMTEMAWYLLSAARALPRMLAREKPDGIIVFFSLPCGPLGLLGWWLARVPYVVSLRGGDVPGTEPGLRPIYALLTPVRRLVLRKARAVIANSEGLKALSEAADPIPVEVIPNGVDVQFFTPVQRPTGETFTFLFVGRFQPQKNLPFLLAAFAKLQARAAPPFRLTLVGDGPMRQELQSLARSLDIDPLVTWHGWCDKSTLRSHYQAADCFVNPSLYEGMPNTVLEAMASGLPVVASDVAGNRTVVVNGETGWLYADRDEEALVGALASCLADGNMARKRGERGRRRAEESYSWRNVAQRYVEVLQGAPRMEKD